MRLRVPVHLRPPWVCPDLPEAPPPVQEVEGDQFRHLVRALCPSIFGHELVKAGLLLSLAGGVRKYSANSNKAGLSHPDLALASETPN